MVGAACLHLGAFFVSLLLLAPAGCCAACFWHHRRLLCGSARGGAGSQPSSAALGAELKRTAGFVSFMVMNYMMLTEANNFLEGSLEFLYLSFHRVEKFFTIHV